MFQLLRIMLLLPVRHRHHDDHRQFIFARLSRSADTAWRHYHCQDMARSSSAVGGMYIGMTGPTPFVKCCSQSSTALTDDTSSCIGHRNSLSESWAYGTLIPEYCRQELRCSVTVLALDRLLTSSGKEAVAWATSICSSRSRLKVLISISLPLVTSPKSGPTAH